MYLLSVVASVDLLTEVCTLLPCVRKLLSKWCFCWECESCVKLECTMLITEYNISALF